MLWFFTEKNTILFRPFLSFSEIRLNLNPKKPRKSDDYFVLKFNTVMPTLQNKFTVTPLVSNKPLKLFFIYLLVNLDQWNLLVMPIVLFSKLWQISQPFCLTRECPVEDVVTIWNVCFGGVEPYLNGLTFLNSMLQKPL